MLSGAERKFLARLERQAVNIKFPRIYKRSCDPQPSLLDFDFEDLRNRRSSIPSRLNLKTRKNSTMENEKGDIVDLYVILFLFRMPLQISP